MKINKSAAAGSVIEHPNIKCSFPLSELKDVSVRRLYHFPIIKSILFVLTFNPPFSRAPSGLGLVGRRGWGGSPLGRRRWEDDGRKTLL